MEAQLQNRQDTIDMLEEALQDTCKEHSKLMRDHHTKVKEFEDVVRKQEADLRIARNLISGVGSGVNGVVGDFVVGDGTSAGFRSGSAGAAGGAGGGVARQTPVALAAAASGRRRTGSTEARTRAGSGRLGRKYTSNINSGFGGGSNLVIGGGGGGGGGNIAVPLIVGPEGARRRSSLEVAPPVLEEA